MCTTLERILLQYVSDLLPFSSSIYEDSEIRGMKSLNEGHNFEDYERLLIELNSNTNKSHIIHNEIFNHFFKFLDFFFIVS